MNKQKIFFSWLPIALTSIFICGTVYAVVQHVVRINANDQQIQIAEDVADLLVGGRAPASIVQPGLSLDITKSQAIFIAIYDDSGKPITSTFQINGKTPTLPVGVFDYVRKHAEDRFTWQPQKNVRSAVVVTRYSSATQSGFVIVGKSLREVEKLESDILFETLAGLIFTLAVSFAVVYYIKKTESQS